MFVKLLRARAYFHKALNFTYINVCSEYVLTHNWLKRKCSRGRRTRERKTVAVIIITTIFSSMINYTSLYISFQLILRLPPVAKLLPKMKWSSSVPHARKRGFKELPEIDFIGA
jgi:hypothetical protein